MHKKFLMLALAAVAVGALAVPAGASAATTATCTLTGVAGNISPPIQPRPATGGSGSYTFQGSAVCTANGTVYPNATIKSTGTFVNETCGTGTADGDATNATTGKGTKIDLNSDGDTSDPNEVSSAAYHIDFTDGVGLLDVTAINGSSEGGLLEPDGEITIIPSSGDCVTTAVSAFRVLGTFVVEY